MSFFNALLKRRPQAESIVAVDIGADSVAGSYVRYEPNILPTIIYTRRLPIEARPDEPHERAMLRALDLLGKDLITDGAPALARATGSGSASLVLVSVDAPWQETKVHVEIFEEQQPFVFTKNLVVKRLEEATRTQDDQLVADQSIIGTILNGYETRNPYGASVKRASAIILTSLIKKTVADDIIRILRGTYHTKEILPIAGSSLRYQTLREIFPHESEALILDTTGNNELSLALIRNGILVSFSQAPVADGKDTWVATLKTELTRLSTENPLPRTIFLLSRDEEIETYKKTLDTLNFGNLWLSDNPPKIVPVTRGITTDLVTTVATNPADIVLLLMAMYGKNCRQQAREDV